MKKNAKDIKLDLRALKLHAMVVGQPGTGKSIFASSFPEPMYVFDFDRGILSYAGKDADYVTFDISPEGWMAFEKTSANLFENINRGTAKYNTLVIDSTSSMTDCAMARALQLNQSRSPAGGPVWTIHYGLVKTMIEGQMRKFTNCNLNVVVISHVRTNKDELTGAVSMEPLLTGDLSVRLPGYFDELYYSIVKKDQGGHKYLLQTKASGYFNARSRLAGLTGKIPEYVENDYDKLIGYLK